jgi:hypothetical protein
MAALGDERAVPYLTDIMLRTADLQVVCLEALASLGAARAAEQVAGLLASEDVDVRKAAVACLGRIGDPKQANAVRALLNDSSGDVRNVAREVLSRWAMSTEAATERQLSMLDQLLLAVVQREGDDLIRRGRRPTLSASKGDDPARTCCRRLAVGAHAPLTFRQQEDLEAGDVDFSYESRPSGCVFASTSTPGGQAGNRVPADQPHGRRAGTLGLPETCAAWATKNGLVLVGGPPARQSTTLAALVDYINRTSARRIIVQDPSSISTSASSASNQSARWARTDLLENALRATLRQDQRLVGEMRDQPTISFAVTAPGPP